METGAQHRLILRAGEHLGHAGLAESPLEAGHGAEGFLDAEPLGFGGRPAGHPGDAASPQAIVAAVAAHPRGGGIAEVPQDGGVAALLRIDEAQQTPQPGLIPVGFLTQKVQVQVVNVRRGRPRRQQRGPLVCVGNPTYYVQPAQHAQGRLHGHLVGATTRGNLSEDRRGGHRFAPGTGQTGHLPPEATDNAGGRIGPFIEKLLGAHVRVVVQQLAVGRRTVPPGPAGLLIVRLQASGHLPMHDESQVSAIDAHAKGVGGHHHVHLPGDELILGITPDLVAHAGVVAHTANTVCPQPRRDLLDALAGGAVDDSRAVLHREAQGPTVLVVLSTNLGHRQGQSRPGEAADHHLRSVPGLDAQRELPDDVVAHLGGGRGGEAEHLGLAEPRQHLGQLEIVRTEVVAPHGDAVGLIHGKEVHPRENHGLHKARAAEPLRGHVHEVVASVGQVPQALVALGRREARVHKGGRNSAGDQAVYLILHQSDERRDDQGESRPKDRRQLKAQGLAPARGHHRQAVPAGHDSLDDSLLPLSEGCEAKVTLERVLSSGTSHVSVVIGPLPSVVARKIQTPSLYANNPIMGPTRYRAAMKVKATPRITFTTNAGTTFCSRAPT